MKPIQSLMIGVLLFTTGCFSTPTAPPPTATQFTPTAVIVTPVPTSTPPPVTFSPILYREFTDRYYSFKILGGVKDGVWITDDDTHGLIQYGLRYDIYHTNGFAGATIVTNIESVEPPFCGSYYVGSDMTETTPNMFGFAQGWLVTVRPYTEILVDNQEYQRIVSDWLKSQGVANPEIHISRIVKADIEGDGVDEVFIAATHIQNSNTPLTELGDYSIVLMRKVSGNNAVNVPLVNDVYRSNQPEPTYPYSHFLEQFIDLNQDGRLEVVLKVTRWEGSGIVVFEVKDFQAVQVLKEVCTE